MVNKYFIAIRTCVCSLFFCLSTLSYATPVVDLDDPGELDAAKRLHDYYFEKGSAASYAYSVWDSASYNKAVQYQKLLKAGVFLTGAYERLREIGDAGEEAGDDGIFSVKQMFLDDCVRIRKICERIGDNCPRKGMRSEDCANSLERNCENILEGSCANILKDSVPETFLSAFRKLEISTSQQLDYLLAAYKSPLYANETPDLKRLVSLYHAVSYGSAVQATMQNNRYLGFHKNLTLWFLANFPFYPVFKPHLKQFLKSTYANSATPTLYNVNSHVISAALSYENEDYLEDLGKEIGFSLLWTLSCNSNSEELRNEVSFMESCKLDKHSGYPNLKGLKSYESYSLASTASPGSSKIHLTPVLDYVKNFSREESNPGDYSKQSLHHLMSKVLKDKTEGAMFFVLYRGAEKYQFFTVGVYRGFLAMSYIADDHAPTPFLNFLVPIKGINLDVLVDGMHEQLHQSKSNRDMVPDLQGVWLMSSQ